MAGSIEYRSVSVHSPTGQTILSDISLRIEPGEAVAFIGRSGAGKTTALRLVNGLAIASAGTVLIDDVPIAAHDLVALRRGIGTMSQGIGLFPHRTVYENVATVPRLLGWNEATIRARATTLLDALAIPWDRFATRYPRTLSGGEQQRVGIARALVARPGILLCDEPFAALDPIVRAEQQLAFLRLRHEHGVTMIFVTHDLHEALTVGERILLFDGGRIVADCASSQLMALDLPLARDLIRASRIPELSA